MNTSLFPIAGIAYNPHLRGEIKKNQFLAYDKESDDEGVSHKRGYKVTDAFGPWHQHTVKKQNIYLGCYVLRFRRGETQVAVFAAEDHFAFPAGTAFCDTLLFVLSHALFRSSSMALQFIGPKPGETPSVETGFEPRIPLEVQKLAKAFDILLTHPDRITDREGRALYIAITEEHLDLPALFPGDLDLQLQSALLFYRTIWLPSSIQAIAKYANDCPAILYGHQSSIYPIANKARLDHQLLLVSLASERAIAWIRMRSGKGNHLWVDCRWEDQRSLYVTPESEIVLTPDMGDALTVNSDHPAFFCLYPDHLQGYEFRMSEMVSRFSTEGNPIWVVTPDIRDAARSMAQLQELVKERGVRVYFLPEMYCEMEMELIKRQQQASSTNKQPPEDRE